jgi:hypothetical protein
MDWGWGLTLPVTEKMELVKVVVFHTIPFQAFGSARFVRALFASESSLFSTCITDLFCQKICSSVNLFVNFYV